MNMTNHRKFKPHLHVLTFFSLLIAIGVSISCTKKKKPDETSEITAITPQEISELERNIPPPRSDAIGLDIKYPLRNGADVTIKKRWIWVPPGEKIHLNGMFGRGDLHVPSGTRIWKEFYARSQDKDVLIERRLLLKVDPGQGNDGWRFFTAYRFPGSQSASAGTIYRKSTDLSGFALNPADPAPTIPYTGDLHLTWEGGKRKYIFPGTRNCLFCHGGAAAAYPGTITKPVYAFGLHPSAMTEDSLNKILAKGWMDKGTTDALKGGRKENPQTPLTNKVLGHFQNNCISCHSTAPQAAARHTAFRLEPHKTYSVDELLKAVSLPARSGLKVIVPGKPENSELILRVKGQARAPMPPHEGGTPAIDNELVTLFSEWVSKIGGGAPQ
jgi:hypothetical protein